MRPIIATLFVGFDERDYAPLIIEREHGPNVVNEVLAARTSLTAMFRAEH